MLVEGVGTLQSANYRKGNEAEKKRSLVDDNTMCFLTKALTLESISQLNS